QTRKHFILQPLFTIRAVIYISDMPIQPLLEMQWHVINVFGAMMCVIGLERMSMGRKYKKQHMKQIWSQMHTSTILLVQYRNYGRRDRKSTRLNSSHVSISF